jgi:hypothetical protein
MVYGIDRELYSPLIITLFPTVIERELKSVTLYNNININKWNQPHINHGEDSKYNQLYPRFLMKFLRANAISL